MTRLPTTSGSLNLAHLASFCMISHPPVRPHLLDSLVDHPHETRHQHSGGGKRERVLKAQSPQQPCAWLGQAPRAFNTTLAPCSLLRRLFFPACDSQKSLTAWGRKNSSVKSHSLQAAHVFCTQAPQGLPSTTRAAGRSAASWQLKAYVLHPA